MLYLLSLLFNGPWWRDSEINHSINYLLCKHEDLGLDNQYSYKMPVLIVSSCNPRNGEAAREEVWISVDQGSGGGDYGLVYSAKPMSQVLNTKRAGLKK